jgi:glycosyltransferase involved in cell wall biosynthesis
MSRPRLLAVGQALNASGYARVMESLLPPLSGAFDVVLFAPTHRGPPLRRDGIEIRGSTILGDPFGREELPRVLEDVRPDVVLVQVDVALLPALAPALAAADARVVVYCPVDWPQPPPSLAFADDVVTYTEYGRGVIGRSARVIPHGVDTDRFTPLGTRRDDEFVVLNANRNVKRKRVDLTLRGFALFARDRPRARLHLHMGPRDGGFPVHALAAELGIEGRVTLTPCEGRRPSVSDEELQRIYNGAHVGLNTCEAEGWGLVAFEHAATGAPQVMPDHSACGELWRDRAVLLPTEPSPEDVAAALGRLHDDPVLREEMGRRALAHARDPRFAWGTIARQWEEVLAPGALRRIA